MTTTRKPPWDRPAPKRGKRAGTHLTASDERKARARAKKAGRRYPNLVDNMQVAREKKRRTRKRSG